MKSRNDRILDWVVKKVQLEYSKDICLLLVYGSYINGTTSSLSDVDFYFIPKNKKASSLGRTFIIKGVGYDLWSMSWERIEGLAELKESLTPLLGNAKIVFTGSDEDTKRFEKLQDVLSNNLNDALFMHRKALEKLNQTNNIFSKLTVQKDLCKSRLFAGDILLQLADAVAYENQTYFKKGWKTQFADLKMMNCLPVDFLTGYETVIKSNAVFQIQENCGKLIESCNDFLNYHQKPAASSDKIDKPAQAPQVVDFKQLANLYGELISTFNKVYTSCENGNGILAFISGVCLQHVLNDEVPGIRFDILTGYDIADLGRFSASVKSVESELVKYITQGATINKYASVDEFLMANQ